MTEHQHDVVIVGGGPAGVSAALECVDIQLDTVLLEAAPAPGGQLAEILHSVRNVAAGRYPNGLALQASLQAAAEPLGDRILVDHPVNGAGLAQGWVDAGGARFHGRVLLIATGSARQEYLAAADGAYGGDVTYQLESHRDRFEGRPVVVVGGGDSATLDALELATTASSVTLVHRSEALTARNDIVARVRDEPRITDLPGWIVESAQGGRHLEEVVLVQPATGARKVVKTGGLVVKISRVPNTEAYRGQLDLDHRGFVLTDGDLTTSIPGVFAAGDVVSGAYWRVAYALGQGSLAARTMLRHLEQERRGR